MSLDSFPNTKPVQPVRNEFDGELKKKVAIVDTSEALEEQARDIAEERLAVSKDELQGLKGFFSKIWKHNLFLEYYRQKEIALAKEEITESENLYVGESVGQEAHNQAMSAVVDRFIQEYEEVIHTEAGEERKLVGDESEEDIQISASVRDLIREYASGSIDDVQFNEERNRIIADATGLTGERLQNVVNHTDNLFEIARQSKIAFEHGACLDDIDQGIEVVIGKAKMGVRTESNYTMVDRVSEKIRSTKVGRFVNEATIASGVAIAYSVTIGLSQRLARSKAFAWGTFGASALVGGAIAGAREGVKVEDERRQHSRERAKGKVMTPDMQRRMEIEKTRYKTVPAKTLYESLDSLSNRITGPEDFFGAVGALAEIETRVRLSDTRSIDLISYSDFKTVEQERLDLDIARAKAKVKLRQLVSDGVIELPDGNSFDEFYSSTLETQSTGLHEGDEGMEMKDRLFKKMKRKKVAGAAFKAVVTGVAVGGLAQEATAFFNDTKGGFVEHAVGMDTGTTPESVTALEGLRRWMDIESDGGDTSGPVGPEDGSNIVPPNDGGTEHVVPENGPKNEPQNIVAEVPSPSEVQGGGVVLNQAVTHENVITQSKEYADSHPEMFQKIERKLWYDNNTSKFDLNELKTHFGGVSGSGIDSEGKYVMSISKMTKDGSFTNGLSVDAEEALKNKSLKMLLSLSKDSQSSVVEVPIDESGKMVLDPNSEIAKMFFRNENGQLKFVGKFMEVAQSVGTSEDGVEQYNILSTVVGSGQDTVSTVETVVKDIPVIPAEDTEKYVVPLEKTPPILEADPIQEVDPIEETPSDEDVDLPFVEPPLFIPVFGREPLEKMSNPKLDDSNYMYSGFTSIRRKDYEHRMSAELRENPDATLDEKKEIKEYLARQEREHAEIIEELVSEAGPMSPECKLSVCIPVAGHQEEKVIYKTLENYLNQSANKAEFEIVLLVNHPDKDKDGNEVLPDKTIDEIRRFMTDHPEVQVSLMHAVIPLEKARIGYVRKLLNDAVLQRNIARGDSAPQLIMVSNDADNKGVASEYVQNFIDKFEEHPETDAFMGQLDWDLESYTRNPLIHIGTRLFQYVDVQLRRADKDNIPSSGANFAFRSGVYAAVNGYQEHMGLAEDVDLGRAIKAARTNSKTKKAVDFGGARVSRLFTSSRRAEKAVKDGLSPVEQWNNGFSAFDDEVRKIDWEAIANTIDYDRPEGVKMLVDNLERIINRSMKAMTWVNKDQQVFQRALGWLGIKYKLVGVNQIKITDATKLLRGLKQYQTEATEILTRKQAPLRA